MWLKTLCLLFVFSSPAFGLRVESITPRVPLFNPPLEWSTDKSYQYVFNARTVQRAENQLLEGKTAEGILSMQWNSEKVLVGNIDFKWGGYGVDAKREPFMATLNRGQVTDLNVSPDSDKWNVELIRAILSQIQVSDVNRNDTEFSVMEESVTGKCETKYKFSPSKTIEKTKNYMNCEKVPVYERGVFGKDNWEALMKKQDIIQRTSTTEMNFGKESFPIEIKTKEQIELKSEKSSVTFETTMTIIFNSMTDAIHFDPEEDFISVGGLMYQPNPQKKFCNRNGGLNRNEIETSCEVDYFMNPKHFATLNDEDQVSVAQDMIEIIAEDLKTPSEMPKSNILDRFTMVVGIIRRMNVKELEQVSNMWEFENRETFVYQSALTVAGTLDSLLMIKSLKKNGILRSELDITEMPSSVHPLTLEYLDTFFDFATDPEIMESDFDFSKDMILDFTNLVRRYITEKEKPFEMEQLNRLILKKYRKYFSSKLQENLNRDNLKFQVYVRAVGNMADLSLFNYLLSLKPGKLSPFQKTLVVNSMDKTLELYPAKSRVMLAKLYENEDEGVSVRIAAMYQLFKTDLPNDMVLDIIQVAKDSGDKEIKNAVKTTVMSHAYSYHLNEEISGLAEELIPDETPETGKKERLSTHKFQDRSDNVTKSHDIFEYIKSYDENPLSMFFKRITDRKGFKTDLKMSGMFNNLDDFIRGLNKPRSSLYGMRGYAEKLRTKLSSANFEIDKDFRQLFVPLENLSSDDLSFSKFFERDQLFVDSTLSMEEVEIGFPTEIGFPFLYSHQAPEYMSYLISTDVEDTFTMKINWIWSYRRQTKMGIMNPISGKYYVIGVDMNQQINVPITVSYNSILGTYFVISIDPLFKEGNQRILHLGTWPYIGQRDIFPLVVTAEDGGIVNVKNLDIKTAKQYLDDSHRFLVQVTSSKLNSTKDVTEYFTGGDLDAYEYFGAFGEVFPKHNLFNIFFKEDVDFPTSLVFTLDLSSNKMLINRMDEPYGKIQGPFLFMGKTLFKASVDLTGPTNRSVSLSATQATDLLTQVIKISLEGSYSENDTKTFQGCYDTVIGDQRMSFSESNENNNLVIFIKMRGGKSCEEGGLLTLETVVDPEELKKSSKIKAEVAVDFKDIPDEIAVEICKLSEEDYDSKVENIHLKFVQKNDELCKELIRNEKNENNENIEEVDIINVENVEDVEETTFSNVEVVDVMWDESSI